MLNNRQETMRQAAAFFTGEIDRLITKPVRLMEVCGTHTVAIFRAGIRQLLPPQVELVSGPGCPVCVTPNDYLDTAVAYSRLPDVIITTFGDMLRVPGSASSLAAEKAAGSDIRIVYSPLESLDIAAAHPEKKIIFLAVGFETTAPLAAATVLEAERRGLANFYVLSAHKLVPPALSALLADREVRVDGFLLPGNVSAMIGEQPYCFLAEKYHLPGVIAGFDPLDILQSVYMLARQIHASTAIVENQYRRIVRHEGNPAARQVLTQVYETVDAAWRGMGVIPASGLGVNDRYRRFNALAALPLQVEKASEQAACRCGEVLRGIIKPADCLLFGKACVPEHPVGSCMVSVEGTCAAWYKYGAGKWQV
ncbi:hydrogenase formation protein HypD [Acetonema longum]|uniref:Hydrogenase isoenzymes formation protein HypD n=1 Tax=Acetonema longum DSM 6540 TaxID=1009370 RepID=F7NIS9_9FIRM|nr:hydrogenase formation protein HypD [Acetonema longum]EGO64052.1 hydrogenase isoenzymes formation protein HypD [Acetonema longum DSM 6540]